MTDTGLPLAVFTINEQPISFYFGPLAAGTPCGICGAVSLDSSLRDGASLKAGGLGFLCPDCIAGAHPGLDDIVRGLDYLVTGLIEARASDELLRYEAIAGQVNWTVQMLTAHICSMPVELAADH